MEFVRKVYTSIVSRQIAYQVRRGQSFDNAAWQTSYAVSAFMVTNVFTVAIGLGWRPRSRFELMPIVIGFVVFGIFERVNERLIRRWVGSQSELGLSRWPSFLLLLYFLVSSVLLILVMNLMLSPR